MSVGLLFQVSIFSGAIAERADVWSYFFYSIIIAGWCIYAQYISDVASSLNLF